MVSLRSADSTKALARLISSASNHMDVNPLYKSLTYTQSLSILKKYDIDFVNIRTQYNN
jgi:hypothetical protein